jgi:predicted DCC family thiol-disulfide oxidoreductase YuxK
MDLRVSNPPARSLMVFDGDCGFCRKWISRWRRWTGDGMDFTPYQEAAPLYPEIPLERFKKAVQLIEPDGRVTGGALAVFRGLAVRPWFRWLPRAHARIPGFGYLCEKFYSFVADHRSLLSSVDSCGLSSPDERPSYFLGRWFFLKILALVYLAAFGSLGFQVRGLIGKDGILPADQFLREVYAHWGSRALGVLPTLCWWNAGDGFLLFLCWGGAALSIMLLFDAAPFFCLPLLWVFYLSLTGVGQDFLGFQWDNLLLESGLLAVFLVPFRFRMGRSRKNPPSGMAVFLLRWLLFRLMWSSGAVKLASGDPSWRHLTALRYHYETQPLPTRLAWYMNQLPAWFQEASCLFALGVELAVPFLLFGPRRWRPAALGLLALLQVLILLTGNYGFFNYLTLGLCLFALEDAAWPGVFKAWWERGGEHPKGPARGWPAWAVGILGAVVLSVSGLQMAQLAGFPLEPPGFLEAAVRGLEPFRSINAYGLFAVMTRTRSEIIVSGSDDGVHWKDYGFRWKPGNLRAPPSFVAPYQPRLDWQMWFAALGPFQDSPWFGNFLARLPEGSKSVLGLLGDNPFPKAPPRMVRAELFQYHFTDPAGKARSGDWWKRSGEASYAGPFSLRKGPGPAP